MRIEQDAVIAPNVLLLDANKAFGADVGFG